MRGWKNAQTDEGQRNNLAPIYVSLLVIMAKVAPMQYWDTRPRAVAQQHNGGHPPQQKTQ